MSQRWGRCLLACSAAVAAGCYEVPPVIPADFIGSPAAPGWPPLAVYDADPFAPRNRWFHRAFSPRGPGGVLLSVHADAPLPVLDGLTLVDRAELDALLGLILEPDPGNTGGSPAEGEFRAGIAGLLFRSDALAAAARWAEPGRNEGDWSELAARLTRAAMGRAPPPELLGAIELRPPPLREGSWLESAPPPAAGIEPAPLDPRWARVLRRSARDETLLLRLRVALDFRREPLLLDLASECWLLGPGPGAARLWLFDRAEWLGGRDPWREVPGGDDVSERGSALASSLREATALAAEPRSPADAVRAALAPVVH